MKNAQVSSQASETSLTYTAAGRIFEGVVVRPKAGGSRWPAVIVAHDFLGVGPNTLEIARKLAALGYVAVAADVYGQGKRPHDDTEALAMAKGVRSDVRGLRVVMRTVYDVTTRLPYVDPQRVAVLGYSVGGVAALELARTGAPLRGVALLWAVLDNAEAATAKPIRCKVLLQQGALDPFAPADTVRAFEEEMKAQGTQLEVSIFPGVAHAYTLPSVGSDVSTGYAYNAAASESSWRALVEFLNQTLR